MDCTFTKPNAVCQPAEWVVATACDKCEEQAVIEVCGRHYDAFQRYASNTGPMVACSECYGSVSFVAQNLRGDSLLEYVNP